MGLKLSTPWVTAACFPDCLSYSLFVVIPTLRSFKSTLLFAPTNLKSLRRWKWNGALKILSEGSLRFQTGCQRARSVREQSKIRAGKRRLPAATHLPTRLHSPSLWAEQLQRANLNLIWIKFYTIHMRGLPSQVCVFTFLVQVLVLNHTSLTSSYIFGMGMLLPLEPWRKKPGPIC